MANRLKGLILRAIGLVDKGANQHAEIVLAKRDDSEDAVQKQQYASMEECMKAEGDPAKCKDLMAAMKRADPKESDMPDVTKADVEALQKRLEDSEKARKETDARLAKMQEDEAIRKAEGVLRGFKALPVDVAKFAPLYRKMTAALTPEEVTEVEKVFHTASDQIAAGNLLKEVGKGGASLIGADPYAKLEALANGLIQKGEKLTFAQAFRKVCDSDEGKRLYDEYEHERQEAARGR